MAGGTNNPSIHYIDRGKLAPVGDHRLCENFWRNIKAFHSATYGPDSAYNFAACNEHGIRMEGRGWGRDSAANGGENGVWYNAGSRALVMLIGGDDVISPALERAIADFADEAIRDHGMEPPLKAHSDYVATSCCGDNGRAAVARYNAGVTPEPTRKKAKMVLFSTIEHGVTTYYRDAGGILVTLSPAEAAPYYDGIKSGDVAVIALGGTLAAVAYNQRTLDARKTLEQLGV